MVRNSKLYPIVCLITGTFIITVGIYTLTVGEAVLQAVCYLGGAVVGIHGVKLAFSALLKRRILSKDAVGSILVNSGFNVLVGIFVMLLPLFNMVPVYFVFTLYVFVNAMIKILDYIIDRRDNVSGRLKELLLFVFFFVFGVLMVFVPGMGRRGFLIVVGIYCILYGGFLISDFIFQLLPEEIRSRISHKLSLPMPVILSAMRPFLNMKNRQRSNILNPEKEAKRLGTYYPEGKKTDIPPDMEVMVHVSNSGLGSFGHCDLCFEGEVFSYGSYDLDTVSMFGGVGDGILVVGKKESYIRFYVTATEREIYSYGFHLTKEQKKAVKQELNELKDMVYQWKPPLGQRFEEDPSVKGEAVFDWGSKMWNCTGSDFYKFKSGKMKTYFAVTSNCVMMVDNIVRKACSETTTPRSVLTPGGYYDYLEHQLAMVGSPVFCRTIYNDKNTVNWKYHPRIPYSDPKYEKRMTETEANQMAAEQKRLEKEAAMEKEKKSAQ